MTEWRKSSRSGSLECVEVALDWPDMSATSTGPRCVRPAHQSRSMVHVRDSKDPDGPVLTFTTAEWAAFVAALKGGTL